MFRKNNLITSHGAIIWKDEEAFKLPLPEMSAYYCVVNYRRMFVVSQFLDFTSPAKDVLMKIKRMTILIQGEKNNNNLNTQTNKPRKIGQRWHHEGATERSSSWKKYFNHQAVTIVCSQFETRKLTITTKITNMSMTRKLKYVIENISILNCGYFHETSVFIVLSLRFYRIMCWAGGGKWSNITRLHRED